MACLDKDAEIARLRAELKAALDALEAAPEAEYEWVAEDTTWCVYYREWYDGQRQEALGLTGADDD